MIFDVLLILTVIIGGGLLLFPVKVRFSFRGQRNENWFALHLFHKKVFSTEEKIEKSDDDLTADAEVRASQEDDFDDENPWKKDEIKTVEVKAPVEEKAKKNAPKKDEKPSVERSPESSKKKSQPAKTPKKKNPRKSSDEEFLTLIFEPGFDRKILTRSFQMSRSFFRIFHCYFEPTVVDGLRLDDYEEMGYAMGGLNFMCGVIPLFRNWEFLMDWEGNRPLRIEGGFVASFSIARILGFGLVSFVSVAELAWIYWMNHRRYKKNPESFRLVFWRRWMVRFLCKS